MCTYRLSHRKSVHINKGPSYEYPTAILELKDSGTLHTKTRKTGEDHDSEVENGNPFQSISTGIRKSFAGKVSINSYAGNAASDPDSVKPGSNSVEPKATLQAYVNLDPGFSTSDGIPMKKSKSIYQPSKQSFLLLACRQGNKDYCP